MDVMVTDRDWLSLFGLKETCAVRDIIKKTSGSNAVVQTILKEGSLSTRIRRSLNGDLSQSSIQHTWRRLAGCLDNNVMFTS